MSKLEDLVPPLKLCRMIPAGKFNDSALVWGEDYALNKVIQRCWNSFLNNEPITLYYKGIPAPTLAEIMDADHRIHIARSYNDKTWVADCWVNGKWIARNAITPATAALRLWLEVNGVEVEK